MGAYLSSPALEKKSQDFEDNDHYQCGVSGMQGWRISMEDAHNCIPDIGDGTSLFAVYDGHGGSEVAMYCALHFADELKNREEYKDGSLENALSSTFMEMDRKLKEPGTIRELKVLSQKEPGDPPPTEEDYKQMEKEEESDEEETKLLHEEATMNIDDLLARYGRVANQTKEALESMQTDQEEIQSDSAEKLDKEELNESTSSKDNAKEEKSTSETEASSDQKAGGDAVGKAEAEAASEAKDKDTNGKESQKTKEKLVKKKFVKSKLAKPDADDSSEDEDYDGFESDEAIGGSSSEEDDSEEDSEDMEDEEEDEEEEEEEEVGEEKEEGATLADLGAMASGTELPGADSGTTAVVALLRDLDLHVANAGDSRCVLCRKDGKAFDMSDDHKPEDEKELARISAAGGHVNAQGRVNGGLNLSRAIGDHCYKTNEKLPLEEQMISAFPDIRTVKLEVGDEFMILACDGIWNVLSSQEVVDFVRERLTPQSESQSTENGAGDHKPMKLSQICEELFDKCLAPDTMGDGTGCDNMTCLIIKFDQQWIEKSSCKVAPEGPKENTATDGVADDGAIAEKIRQQSDKTGDVIEADDSDDVKASKRPRTDDVEVRVNGDNVEAKRIKTD